MRPDRHAVGRLAIVVAGLAAALVLPRLIYPVLALEILLWGLFAMSVDLLLGFAGLLSFGHAAFWGIGGYAAALLARAFQLPFPVAALAGTAAAALLAIPIGFLSIRRRGIYFAMVTLAFAQLVYYVVNEWRSGVPRLLPGFSVGRSLDFYYAALPLVLVGFFVAYRVVHSPFGHVLTAIRDNEPRAQSLGYATWRYKLIGFVLSGALAGLAGSLFALGHGFASLELLHFSTSGEAVLMTILGGIGTLWGGLVGAAVVLLVRDTLSTASEASGVVTGAIFLVIVLAFRRGVLGTVGERLTWLRERRAAAGVVGAEGRGR